VLFRSPQPGRVERASRRAAGGTPDNPVYEHRYEVVEYRFISARLNGSEDSAPTPLPDGYTPPGRPKPYILVDHAVAELRYLAVVYRDVAQRLPRDFRSVHGRHRLAYGQAKVYNPTSFDTFTQDWRVTLEPATLVEEVAGLGSPGSLSGLSGILNAGALVEGGLLEQLRQDLDILRRVNNH